VPLFLLLHKRVLE